MSPLLRYLWPAPYTAAGLLLAVLARLGGGRVHAHTGVLEAHGGLLEALLKRAPIAGGASAMTLGHVVIGRGADELARTRAHERVHVRQYERWGVCFVPAYFFACAVAAARGHYAYFDSRFEREAYARDGVAVRRIPRRPPVVRWGRRVPALAAAFLAVTQFPASWPASAVAALAAPLLLVWAEAGPRTHFRPAPTDTRPR